MSRCVGYSGDTTNGFQTDPLEARILLGRRGEVRIIAPVDETICSGQEKQVLAHQIQRHAIHRAINWRAELDSAASLRSLAARENVSASLVSLHLKLLQLAPDI